MSLTPGTKLGPYEIVAPIGAGGMGEVYRAKDTRLKRDVAIKVLPERLAKDREALNRFEREGQAVAALSHPNILAIFDVGTEGETSYVVTELLEGETLRQRLLSGPLPWRKAVALCGAVADGLAAAHGKGITHRDLKPDNIFLTNDGVVKILDFGLARIDAGSPSDGGAGAAHTPTITLDTRPGTVIGTLSYMSPEQLRGKPTDPRTDIFSFGCVLLEMITGERAFKGETAADTMTAILRETPDGVRSTHAEVGLELERVIDRCLEKKPEQRFHSAVDLAFTLRSILADSGTVATVQRDRRTPGFSVPVALAGLILAGTAGYLGYRAWSDSAGSIDVPQNVSTVEPDSNEKARSSAVSAEKVRVAILPFDDTSPEPREWFANGMTEAAIDDLAQISGLHVISHTSVKQYRGTRESVPAIAKALNVDFIIAGSVLLDGTRVRIRARLLEGKTDEQIWSERYERDMSDIIALQHDVAQAIVEGIQVTLTPSEQKHLAKTPQVNADAYQLYMIGMNFVRDGNKADCESALKLFDQALELDPTFALAHVGRAAAYYTLSSDYLPPKHAMPQVRQAAQAALALDETLAEAYVALGHYELQFEWNFEAAERTFEKAIESSPNSATARLGYALYLSAMDRGEEAMRQLDFVQEHDPASRYTNFDHGAVSYMAHDYQRTVRDAKAAIAVDPNWWAGHLWLSLASSQQGKHDVAVHHAREAVRLKDSPAWLAMAGGVLAVAGERDDALEIYNSLKSNEALEYVCPYELATIPLGLGDHDTTFEEMDGACEARADCLAWLQVDPRLDPIRDDPRFDRLLSRVGFKPKGVLTLATPPESARITLAVLPFESVTSNPDTDYLKGEIPASIIHTLSALSGLQVTPRSTAFRYKVEDQDTATIGRELGATAVLTGQINIRGETLIIRAELVDVASNSQLWAERYNRKLADIMAIEEDIAKEISEALRLQLTGEERAQLTRRYTENAKAYQHYLKGRYWWNKRTEVGFDKAIALYDKAISIDPDYALAYAGKADCYCLAAWYFVPAREATLKAMEAIDAALALDPSLPEAYASRAWVRTYFDWDWAGAERDFKRAIKLDPDYATAHHWFAGFLASQGRMDEAQREGTRAHELDPGSLIINLSLAIPYLFQRQYDRAIEQYRITLDMDPTFTQARVTLVSALQANQQHDEAIVEIQRLYKDVGRSQKTAGMLAVSYAATGRPEQAREELRKLTMLSKQQYIPAIVFASIHAELGDYDAAFASLNESFEAREGSLVYLAVDPGRDALRDDPRFDDLVRRIGLPTSAPNESSSPGERSD